MSNSKILVLFGTRPEIIKVAPILAAFKEVGLDQQVLVANMGQQKDLLESNLACFDFEVDYSFNLFKTANNLIEMLAQSILAIHQILTEHPSIEWIMVQGDTNTALASAQVAFLSKKKLLHVEAGLRSYNLEHPFPEEFNRIVASKAAHFHFAPTEQAKKNLCQEGIPEKQVLVSGNTVMDSIRLTLEREGEAKSSQTQDDVLITMHRRENKKEREKLVQIVTELAYQYPQLNFKWVEHPNSFQEMKEIKGNIHQQNIQFIPPLPYKDFIQLYTTTKLIITDSGGIQEEATAFGIPLVVFRKKTERSELEGMNYPVIVSTNAILVKQFFNQYIHQQAAKVNVFGNGFAAQKIVGWVKNQMEILSFETVIIGGGPAGTGPLFKAMKDGRFNELLETGIAIVEQSNTLVKGSISQFEVNSDTYSNVFLECLQGKTKQYLPLDELAEEAAFIRSYHGKKIPLNCLEQYLSKLGQLLEQQLLRQPQCAVFKNSTATKVMRQNDGIFLVYLSTYANPIKAKKVVFATGGKALNLKQQALFDGKFTLQPFESKIILADNLLKGKYPQLPAKNTDRGLKTVILGGSHSAFSAAAYLLEHYNNQHVEKHSINIWGTKSPKIYFPTIEEAQEYGYTDFSEQDICPKTQRLYRLAGLRMDGRQLAMQMMGLLKGEKDERVQFNNCRINSSTLQQQLEEADLIILALGYQFGMVPVLNQEGMSIPFLGSLTKHWVNDKAELLDVANQPIKNLMAIGLATGYVPKGELGGENSFHGQTNGLWYYQNLIGNLILEQLLSTQPLDQAAFQST